MTYAKVREAIAAYNNQDWPKAVELYGQVVADNPYDARRWVEYAHALHFSKQFEAAIPAWQKGLELGQSPATQMYNTACAYAMMGKSEEALAWLAKAMDAGFAEEETLRTDKEIDSLRELPRFKEIAGIFPPEGLSREQQWAYDLDFFARRMEQIHYDLYAHVSREDFRAAVDTLKGQASKLTDGEMAVGVQRILAMVGDGHTTLQSGGNMLFTRQLYPIAFYLFTDGLFVTGAGDQAKAALGRRVVRIGKMSATEALEAVEPLISRDNSQWIKLIGPALLRNPQVLYALRIADSADRVAVTVVGENGKDIEVMLGSEPFTPAERLEQASSLSDKPLPLYLRDRDKPFWFEYLPEKKLVWFQYNIVGDDPHETLQKFTERLFGFIDDNLVEYLVIDMRLNHGGNNFLNKPLVSALVKSEKINKKGRLFVVVGRGTFSAAMNGATDIERIAEAIFVGEPTGSKPNFVGESTPLRLPCSGLRMSCSSLYWQRSTAMDERTWIAPALVAELSSEDYLQNRDPALEVIERYIAEMSEQSAATTP